MVQLDLASIHEISFERMGLGILLHEICVVGILNPTCQYLHKLTTAQMYVIRVAEGQTVQLFTTFFSFGSLPRKYYLTLL